MISKLSISTFELKYKQSNKQDKVSLWRYL